MSVRVLHIAWNLEAGGIQTWLLALAKHHNRGLFSVDFAVYEDFEKSLASDIREEGCLVHLLGKVPVRGFETLFSKARYDVVHLHVCPKMNPLSLARDFEVPLRVFHNHNSLGSARAVYRRWRFSRGGFGSINARLSVSKKAALSKFGWRAFLPEYYQLQPAGIDLEPFRVDHDPVQTRRSLNIPQRSFVIGHVGRFVAFKNHMFLLKIAAHLRREEVNFRLLLVGDGPERENILQKARELGVHNYLIFAGDRRDVARLLCAAMDVFVFPSTAGEGLPLALVEAQTAGLPCLVSDVVSRESTIVSSLVHRLSLRVSADHWARLAVSIRCDRMCRADSFSRVENSPVDVRKTIRNLEEFYLSRLAKATNSIKTT